MRRLQVEDLLLIAEDLLGIPAEELIRTTDLGLADSALHAPFARFAGQDFYEGFAVRAAILASRIVRNHPLLDGNKRLALLAMIEFLRRNEQDWPSDLDQGEVAETTLGVRCDQPGVQPIQHRLRVRAEAGVDR